MQLQPLSQPSLQPLPPNKPPLFPPQQKRRRRMMIMQEHPPPFPPKFEPKRPPPQPQEVADKSLIISLQIFCIVYIIHTGKKC